MSGLSVAVPPFVRECLDKIIFFTRSQHAWETDLLAASTDPSCSLIQRTQDCYNQQQPAYKAAKDSILVTTTHMQRTMPYETEMLHDILGQDSQIDVIWRRFQNFFLSRYPEADIRYNENIPLIKPQESLDVGLGIPYSRKRVVAGDGNCFYSCLACGYLTWLCEDPVRLLRGLEKLTSLKGGPGSSVTGETFLHLSENPGQLEKTIANNQQILPLIRCLRHGAALYMKENKETIFEDPDCIPVEETPSPGMVSTTEPAVVYVSLENYISSAVLQMGHDADSFEIAAISNYFGISIKIYDQPSAHTQPVVAQTFTPPNGEMSVALLRTGKNHYTLLCEEFTPPSDQSSIDDSELAWALALSWTIEIPEAPAQLEAPPLPAALALNRGQSTAQCFENTELDNDSAWTASVVICEDFDIDVEEDLDSSIRDDLDSNLRSVP